MGNNALRRSYDSRVCHSVRKLAFVACERLRYGLACASMRRLICALDVRWLQSKITIRDISRFPRSQLLSVVKQGGLNFAWSPILKAGFLETRFINCAYPYLRVRYSIKTTIKPVLKYFNTRSVSHISICLCVIKRNLCGYVFFHVLNSVDRRRQTDVGEKT